MKKEVLLAIIIGFGLGIVIIFGIWRANQNITSREVANVPVLPENTTPTPPAVNEEKPVFLTLTSPVDDLLTDEETLSVTGSTLALNPVVILSGDTEMVTRADSQGFFSADIELNAGLNSLTLITADSRGTEIKKEVSVVYSTAEI